MTQKTVVIVDDSLVIVQQLARFFRNSMGFRVLASGKNGKEASELYKKLRPDLITLDFSMPMANGFQAVKTILAEFPKARILMISAIKTNEVIDCLQYGARGFIEKPLLWNDVNFVNDFKQTLQEAFA